MIFLKECKKIYTNILSSKIGSRRRLWNSLKSFIKNPLMPWAVIAKLEIGKEDKMKNREWHFSSISRKIVIVIYIFFLLPQSELTSWSIVWSKIEMKKVRYFSKEHCWLVLTLIWYLYLFLENILSAKFEEFLNYKCFWIACLHPTHHTYSLNMKLSNFELWPSSIDFITTILQPTWTPSQPFLLVHRRILFHLRRGDRGDDDLSFFGGFWAT